MKNTKISTKGRIVLPANLRQLDGIEPGQEFKIERIVCGEYRLVRRQLPPKVGLVDWLLACPEKGFFVTIGGARQVALTKLNSIRN